jgi:hypothetical protein
MRPSTQACSRSLLISFAALGLAGMGCSNPVTDARVDALGDEVPGVGESEFHRPGQPCLLCHGEYGRADPLMSVGGTIFAAQTKDAAPGIPVGGATVTMWDSFGDSRSYKTNCMGNFWVPKDDWNPGFPIAVKVDCGPPGGEHVMNSRVGRDGSCNRCHQGAQNQGSPGWANCGSADGYPPPTHETCAGGVP